MPGKNRLPDTGLMNQRRALEELDGLCRQLSQLSRSAMPAILESEEEHSMIDLHHMSRSYALVQDIIAEYKPRLDIIVNYRRRELERERDTWSS